MYYIFTDGSCNDVGSSNPKNSLNCGWSFIVTDINYNIIKIASGKLRAGSQNPTRCELEAFYQSLIYMSSMNNSACDFILYSDCEVLIEGILGIAKRKNNRDLWDVIEKSMINYSGRILPRHINSHTKGKDVVCKLNALADKFAKYASLSLINKPIK